MRNLKDFSTFANDNIEHIKNYYETEPLNEEIDLSKMFKHKTEKEKREMALKIINEHPTKKKLYDRFKKENNEKAELFIKFIMKHPYVRYFRWDEDKEEFVDSGKYQRQSF